MVKTVWRILLVLWLASVLFVISLPWWKFDGTPHWQNMSWVPFEGLTFRRPMIFETLANFLSFIPIGYLAVRSFHPGIKGQLLLAGLLGFAASFIIEVYQLFCHHRVPASTDVILNTLGALLGAQVALKLDNIIDFFAPRFGKQTSPPA